MRIDFFCIVYAGFYAETKLVQSFKLRQNERISNFTFFLQLKKVVLSHLFALNAILPPKGGDSEVT
jgi:hypothetical protein